MNPQVIFWDTYGWHPDVQEVVYRLMTLSGLAGCACQSYRDYLVVQIGARVDEGFLVGSVERAVAALRALEARQLEAMCSQEPE